MTDDDKAVAKKAAAAPAPKESAATPEAQETFQLAEEGYDVTQAPATDLDGKSVDYNKSTMPVTNDPETPSDFDPQANR